MKQTSVSWLLSQLDFETAFTYAEEIEQAKEMEKDQIKIAWDNGCEYISENAEQYYNETYESKR